MAGLVSEAFFVPTARILGSLADEWAGGRELADVVVLPPAPDVAVGRIEVVTGGCLAVVPLVATEVEDVGRTWFLFGGAGFGCPGNLLEGTMDATGATLAFVARVLRTGP